MIDNKGRFFPPTERIEIKQEGGRTYRFDQRTTSVFRLIQLVAVVLDQGSIEVETVNIMLESNIMIQNKGEESVLTLMIIIMGMSKTSRLMVQQ